MNLGKNGINKTSVMDLTFRHIITKMLLNMHLNILERECLPMFIHSGP